MSAEENKTTHRRFFEEVINQKHLAVIDEIYDANYVSHSLAPGRSAGREGLKAFVSAFQAAFSDGHISIEQLIAEGDFVATHTTFRGTHTGDFLGMPATGKHVVVPGLDVLRFAHARCRRLVMLNGALTAVRLGVLFGTARGYRRRPWTYWLSPLCRPHNSLTPFFSAPFVRFLV